MLFRGSLWLVAHSLACMWAVASATNDLKVTCDTPWLIPRLCVEDAAPAISLALHDVKQDWYSVLGCRPAMVTSMPPSPPSAMSSQVTSVVFAQGKEVLNGSYSKVPEQCWQGKETHCLALTPDPFLGGMALVVAGADPRGFVFGMYSLSEVVLGVGAMDYWLAIDPVRTTQGVTLPPSLAQEPIVYTAPEFEYRAFFVNDEDLFGRHTPDPNGKSVWSLQQWDRLFQTILRLKANGIIAGTNTFPDDPAWAVAARRGLVLTSHHYNILGLSPVAQSVAQWFPEEYNFQLRPDAMMYAWQSAVEAQASYPEVLFTIGLRGPGDEPTHCYGKCTVADKARHVSWAMGNQTEMMKSVRPGSSFLTWLWDEGLKYLESGYLQVPPNTTVIFADSGDGKVEGLKYAKHGAGIYTHVAMLNGRANQLTEMVPLSRIFGSVSEFVRKKVTKVFILNISDLLPYLMSTQAFFRAVWKSTLYTCNMTLPATCDHVQQNYLVQWSQLTFQLSAVDAARVASAYAAYYSVPYIAQGNADDLLRALTSQAADGVLPTRPITKPAVDGVSFDWAASSRIMCDAYANVSTLPVTPQRVQAFRTTVLNSLGYHCYATAALVAAQAAQHAADSRNLSAAEALLLSSLSSLDQAATVLSQSEGQRFRGLFASDDLTCSPLARRDVLRALDRVRSTKDMNLQWVFEHDQWACPGYSAMYNYQFAFQRASTYPIESSCDNRLNMYYWPQAFCTYVDPSKSTSWCLPNPVGGTFAGHANITLKTSKGVDIKYTTSPTPSSENPKQWTTVHGRNQPHVVTIDTTTTFTVVLADPTPAPFMPPTRALFTKVAA